MTEFVNPQAKYFNAFNLIEGLGPVAFNKILAHFKSLKTAWSTDINEFDQLGLNKPLVEQIRIKRTKINPDWEMERLINHKVKITTLQDKDYPKLLKEIYAPPALLYFRGNLEPNDRLSIGLVGTRQLSPYGRQITPLITASLVRAGLTIVSGLAKGIDTLAHQAALQNKGRTLAVLGTGVDKKSIYPAINKYLAEKITEQGALVSEFPIETQPSVQNFPQRNRLISGLSLGILVIEAPERSGALITARNALEQNREVFAIPGQILSNNSLGTNNLIKMGAKLVSQADDILEELNMI